MFDASRTFRSERSERGSKGIIAQEPYSPYNTWRKKEQLSAYRLGRLTTQFPISVGRSSYWFNALLGCLISDFSNLGHPAYAGHPQTRHDNLCGALYFYEIVAELFEKWIHLGHGEKFF
jgi:hypothetical protein